MPARGGVHSGLKLRVDDVVVPTRDVVYLRPTSEFVRWETRYPWTAGEIGFIIEIDNNIEETGEILLRILTPFHLGWVDSWSVEAI
jgi:hypothetical protein